MFCGNCGTQMSDGSKFCTKCGAKLEGTGAGAQPVPQQGAWQQSAYADAGAQRKNAWQYFVDALTKYAVFTGRARRSEYWFFALFCAIFGIAAVLIQYVILYKFWATTVFTDNYNMIISVINASMSVIMVNAAFYIPGIAVGIRRMHDVGKSGWFILIPIYNIVLAATEGERGQNQYGPDPKQEN